MNHRCKSISSPLWKKGTSVSYCMVHNEHRFPLQVASDNMCKSSIWSVVGPMCLNIYIYREKTELFLERNIVSSLCPMVTWRDKSGNIFMELFLIWSLRWMSTSDHKGYKGPWLFPISLTKLILILLSLYPWLYFSSSFPLFFTPSLQIYPKQPRV